MIRVRLQVIQSLRGLVRVFGGDSSGQSSGPHHGGMSHGAHGWSNHHQHHFDCWR